MLLILAVVYGTILHVAIDENASVAQLKQLISEATI